MISDIEQSERSEIKVQNIQGTRGSEGPWKVFLKTHPYNIYKKWTYAMELFRAAIKSPATPSGRDFQCSRPFKILRAYGPDGLTLQCN